MIDIKLDKENNWMGEQDTAKSRTSLQDSRKSQGNQSYEGGKIWEQNLR